MRPLLAAAFFASATAISIKNVQSEEACTAEDLNQRVLLQNKLAGVCEEMCKEVGAYPKCNSCPKFVEPDSTPGVMTWPELLEHMDNLVEWGQGMLKEWRKTASAIQTASHGAGVQTEQACTTEDLKHRALLQNKLAGVCEEMCKEVQAYPECTCPNFVEPDATPGHMTWDELLGWMDELTAWGGDSIKGWQKQASQLQLANDKKSVTKQGEKACVAEDLKIRAQVQ